MTSFAVVSDRGAVLTACGRDSSRWAPPTPRGESMLAAATAFALWHLHPDLELTLIECGHGRRLVGASNETFTDNDLALIGANLPHAYISAAGSTDNRAVVAHFLPDFADDALGRGREWVPVRALLDQSDCGLAFGRVDSRLRTDMRRLDGLPPVRRTALLLDVLARLADTDRCTPAGQGRAAIGTCAACDHPCRGGVSVRATASAWLRWPWSCTCRAPR